MYDINGNIVVPSWLKWLPWTAVVIGALVSVWIGVEYFFLGVTEWPSRPLVVFGREIADSHYVHGPLEMIFFFVLLGFALGDAVRVIAKDVVDTVFAFISAMFAACLYLTGNLWSYGHANIYKVNLVGGVVAVILIFVLSFLYTGFRNRKGQISEEDRKVKVLLVTYIVSFLSAGMLTIFSGLGTALVWFFLFPAFSLFMVFCSFMSVVIWREIRRSKSAS